MFEMAKAFAVETVTFNSVLGICIYWLPLLLCLIGYTIRTARNLQQDKKDRSAVEKGENTSTGSSFYRPTDTLGDLIGRALISFIPIANFWAAVFDISPQLFCKVFEWIAKTFSQPLVPERGK